MSHIAYVNGRYVPHRLAQVHIEDRGFQFADAVYEVTCIWNGVPVDHAAHLARLERSLKELRSPMPCSRAALTVIVREIVRRNRISKGIVYLQAGRGVAPRNHPFPTKAVRPSLVVTARHGTGPTEATAQKGVAVVTHPDERWGRVDIKSVGLLANALAKQKAVEAKAFEALLVRPDGTVTEASSSNAWMVTKDKVLVTHPLTNQILGGVTRAALLRLAADAGYRVEQRAFTVKEALEAKELFLTGTTTFVLPVVQVDDRTIGNGAPGELSLDLRRRYVAYIDGLDQRAWASS